MTVATASMDAGPLGSARWYSWISTEDGLLPDPVVAKAGDRGRGIG